jgi:hypothetical protein
VRARDVAPPALAGERRLVGAPYGDLSRLIAERGLPPPELGAFATEAAAQAAAAAGEGLMLAIAQTVIDPLRRGSLGRVDLAGAPIDGMWHAATLGAERSSREASALRRFVTTPEATQAIVARPGGVPAASVALGGHGDEGSLQLGAIRMAANTLNILAPSVNNLTTRVFVRAAGLDFEERDVWARRRPPSTWRSTPPISRRCSKRRDCRAARSARPARSWRTSATGTV